MNRMIFRSFRKRKSSQKNTNTVYSEYSYSGMVPKRTRPNCFDVAAKGNPLYRNLVRTFLVPGCPRTELIVSIPASIYFVGAEFKGATSRFVHLEIFSLKFAVRHLQSVLIFSILSHPCSLLVYSCLVGVCLPSQQTTI